MEHEETKHVRDESSGTVREESSTVVNDTGTAPVQEASVVKSSTPARRAMEGIYLLFGIIDALLLIRLVLKLLGANAHAGFASFTYGITDFLLAPFKGLLPTFVSGQSVLELSLIFAILIYGDSGARDRGDASTAGHDHRPHRDLTELGRPLGSKKARRRGRRQPARRPGTATRSRMSCTWRVIQRDMSFARTTSRAASFLFLRSSPFIVNPW